MQRLALGLPRTRGKVHLPWDILRLWQRALHRAEIPLAYSEGFSPHPRISLAAPLPIGVTSQAELMDSFAPKWVLPTLTLHRSRKPATAAWH